MHVEQVAGDAEEVELREVHPPHRRAEEELARPALEPAERVVNDRRREPRRRGGRGGKAGRAVRPGPQTPDHARSALVLALALVLVTRAGIRKEGKHDH